MRDISGGYLGVIWDVFGKDFYKKTIQKLNSRIKYLESKNDIKINMRLSLVLHLELNLMHHWLRGAHFSVFLPLRCPPGWAQGWKMGPKGAPRPPKGDPEIIKNQRKIHSGPPLGAKGYL